jgi:hypothetical protein
VQAKRSAVIAAAAASCSSRIECLSAEASISPTRFWNEYQWGNLKADPAKLVERYFDAHLYFSNWGTHRLMLRLPNAHVDLKALKPYFVGAHAARLTSAGEQCHWTSAATPRSPSTTSRAGAHSPRCFHSEQS